MLDRVLWRYKIATRQAVPIFIGLVGIFAIIIALGYFYTRKQILHTAHTQMRQLAVSVEQQNSYHYQWIIRSAPSLIQTIQRNILRIPFNDNLFTEQMTTAISNTKGNMEVSVTTVLPFFFAASNAPHRSEIYKYPNIIQVRTYDSKIRKSFYAFPSPKAKAIDKDKILNNDQAYWLPLQISNEGTLPLTYVEPLKNSQNLSYGNITITLKTDDFNNKPQQTIGLFKDYIPFFITDQGYWSLPIDSSHYIDKVKVSILSEPHKIHSLNWNNIPYVLKIEQSQQPSLYIGVLVPYAQVFDNFNNIVSIFGLIGFIIIFLAVYSLYKSNNSLLSPLGQLAKVAESLGHGKINPKEFMALPSIENISLETGQILSSTQQLRSALQQRIHDLTVMAHTQEHMHGELALARTIQNSLRPATLPQIDYVKTVAYVHAAREVCGDMYDCFTLSENEICCVIGNVSEHGVPAALLTNRIMPLLHELLLLGHSPSSALKTVNQDFDIPSQHTQALFISSLVGILNTHSGQFQWASAGQVPPFLLNDQFAENHIPYTQLPWSKNVPLGIRKEEEYTLMSLQLKPNQTLLFIPQRVLSVQNLSGKGYGEAGLSAFFSHAQNTPNTLLQAFFEDIQNYTGGNLHDDIVLFAMQWQGKDD